mgnify:CR=1 FL=1
MRCHGFVVRQIEAHEAAATPRGAAPHTPPRARVSASVGAFETLDSLPEQGRVYKHEKQEWTLAGVSQQARLVCSK